MPEVTRLGQRGLDSDDLLADVDKRPEVAGSLDDLGWTEDEIAESEERLRAFAAFWDDPALDAYNEL